MNTKSPGPQVHEIDWLTPRTREALLLAQQEAAQGGRPSIQPEHLLLGVLLQGESKAATLLNKSGLNVGTLRAHTQAVSPSHLSATEPLVARKWQRNAPPVALPLQPSEEQNSVLNVEILSPLEIGSLDTEFPGPICLGPCMQVRLRYTAPLDLVCETKRPLGMSL